MCGIAGIMRCDDAPIPPEKARAMLTHLAQRGPDGRGIREHPRCTLIHTRLAIIDPRGGEQPMHLPARGNESALTVAFNGEIYNHRELRRQLESLGHRFTTDHCDTEVLLHGYRQWGVALPEHLEGMFAFAVWSDGERSLFLCRDRIGKKPLFVRRDRNEIAFASLPAVFGVEPRIDRAALRTFLQLGYTLGPCLLDGVAELPAAHWMLVAPDGGATTQRYWRAPSADHAAGLGLRDALEAAVKRRLEADVTLGCFLSGGIDSSLVAALAKRHLSELRTFSVAMPDLAYDESAYARAVADHIGSKHTQLVAEPSHDVIADLRFLIEQTGEPIADSSILPTYWLSQATRRHVTVVISGDGGDELFAGYDRYRALRWLGRYRGWLRLVPAGLLRSGSEKSRADRLCRLVCAARWSEPESQYRAMMPLFTDEQIRQLGVPGETTALPDWPADADPVRAAMTWDLQHYLPMDVLRKVDRASMAVALEVRCPMLDTAVVELATRLPTQALLAGKQAKAPLRHLAAELLPAAIVHRRKQGFALPIGSWFRGALRQPLSDALLGGGLQSLGLVRQPIERLLDEHMRHVADHSHRLFALVALALWKQWASNR